MVTLLAFICALLSACHSFMSAGSSRPADETTHAATSTAGAASRCVTPPPSAVAHSSAFRLHGSPQRAEYKTPPRGGTALGRGASESKDPIDGTAASIGTPLVLTRTPSYAPVRELTFETEETSTHHHLPPVDVDDDKDITDVLAEAGRMPQGSPEIGVSAKPTLRDSTVDTALGTPTDAAAFVGRLFSPSTGRSTPRTPTFSARRPVSVLGLVGGAGTATPSPDSPGSLATDTFTSTDIVHWFIHHVLQYAQELTATAGTTRASAEKHDLYDSLLDTFIPLCSLVFAADDATDDLSIKIPAGLTEAFGIIQTIEWHSFVELCLNPRAAWRSHRLIATASTEALSIITALANLICAHGKSIQHRTIIHAIILHALSLVPDARISLETIAADELKEAFLQVFMPLYQTEGIDAASLETYVTSTITAFNKIITLAPRVITSDLKKKTVSLLMNHYYTKAHLRTNIALCKRIITSCRDMIDGGMATRCLRALDKKINDAALYTAGDTTYHQMLTQELISLAQTLNPSYGAGARHVFVNHLHILSPTAEITPGSAESPAAAKVGGGHIMTDELYAACDRDKKYAYIFDNDTNETPLGIGSGIVSATVLNWCKITDTFEIEYTGRAFSIFASDAERRDNRDEISKDTKRSSLLFGRGLQGRQLFQCIDILVNEALADDTSTTTSRAAASTAVSYGATRGTCATGGGRATGGSGTRESSLPDLADLGPCLLRREVTLRDGCDFVRVAADIMHKSPTAKSDIRMASRIVLECRLEGSKLIPLRVITLHPLHMVVSTDLKSLLSKLKDKPDLVSAIKFTDLAKSASPSKGVGHAGGAKSPAKGKRAMTPGDTRLVAELCYSNPEILLSPVRGIDERVLMVMMPSDRA